MGLDPILTNIRVLMAKNNWKQGDLASKSGVRPATISDLLNNKKDPSMGTLIKVADAFGVELSTLLDGIERKAAPFAPPERQELIDLILKLNDVEFGRVQTEVIKITTEGFVQPAADKGKMRS